MQRRPRDEKMRDNGKRRWGKEERKKVDKT
jgi:hypothetical protein